MFLYGGNVNHAFDTATWLLRDGKFINLNIPGPGVKYQSGMVYDKHRKKIVLYGGGEKPDELWEFDGTKWERMDTELNPGVKMYHHMAYDENLKAVVLHGGQINHRPLDPKNLETPITWLWDGKNWKKIAEENIFAIAIGYHPVRKSVIAYGYNNGNVNASRDLQLWELKNYKWKKIADYGTWNTIEYLENYLQQKPNNLAALYAYAYNLKSSNRLAEAEAAFKKVVSATTPQKASAFRGLIDVLKSQGKLIEAEEYIVQYEAVGEKRSIAFNYYNLACSYALSGNSDRAFAALHKAIDFGFDVKKDYQEDEDLGSLRSDSRWETLLKRLK